jgi:hypothetical protein
MIVVVIAIVIMIVILVQMFSNIIDKLILLIGVYKNFFDYNIIKKLKNII